MQGNRAIASCESGVARSPVQHAEQVQQHDHAERDAQHPEQEIAGHNIVSEFRCRHHNAAA